MVGSMVTVIALLLGRWVRCDDRARRSEKPFLRSPCQNLQIFLTRYTPRAMRWVDLVKFLDSGVAMLGASADGSRLPEAFRVWGAIAKDDHRIRVLVTSDAS